MYKHVVHREVECRCIPVWSKPFGFEATLHTLSTLPSDLRAHFPSVVVRRWSFGRDAHKYHTEVRVYEPGFCIPPNDRRSHHSVPPRSQGDAMEMELLLDPGCKSHIDSPQCTASGPSRSGMRRHSERISIPQGPDHVVVGRSVEPWCEDVAC